MNRLPLVVDGLPAPAGGLVDDAGVLSKASQKQILKICQQLKVKP